MVTECYNTCFVLRDGDKHLLVDGGGGNTLLAQLKHAGFDWMDMSEIFVTHKHVDHIMGIVWMIRMICQHMKQGQYEGEVTIYGHEEVIRILKEMAEMLYPKKQTCYIGDRLHLVVVEDGEERTLMGHKTTFFDIQSTKAKQFGFCMDMGNGEKFTCCGDEPYNECEKKYAENSKWLLHEAFCLFDQADRFHPYEKHHSTAKDASELAEQLGVQNLIRIGTAGAFTDELALGDIFVALAASTDSNYQHAFDLPGQYSPSASWALLTKALAASSDTGIPFKAGNVVTCDVFYEFGDWWKKWAQMGVQAVEMETAALYMNAAYNHVNALSMISISDNFVTGAKSSVEERQNSFTNMMKLALETAVK